MQFIGFCYICHMSIIDRMHVSNGVFISTVLAIFARTRNVPATAIGELQIVGVLRELFGTLGATEDMAAEYVRIVLRRWPPKKRPRVPDSLQAFLDNKVSPGLLHKYDISPGDLVSSWNFDCLDDPTLLESCNLGASVECEHHSRWKKEQDREAAAQEQPDEVPDEEPPEEEPPEEEPPEDIPDAGNDERHETATPGPEREVTQAELDSLMEL